MKSHANEITGFNPRILNEINRQFEFAERTKDDILFVRYDIRFPDGVDPTNNERVNDAYRSFQTKFMKNLSRHGLKPQYVAVREESASEPPHYHVALMLNGQKAQPVQNHIQTAERLWESTLGIATKENGCGLISDCTTDCHGEKQINGVLLSKGDPEMELKKFDCIQKTSQLAKTDDKGLAPKWQRELFSSRLPK